MSNLNFCKYKDIFGKPNQGLHSYRIFDIAMIDFILTIILAIFLSKILDTNIFLTLVFTFLLGIFAHRLFCVDTTIDRLLFINKNSNY